MLYRKLVRRTFSIFPSATRLFNTQTNNVLKVSSQTTDAALTVNSVCIPVNGSFARVGYADLGCSEGAVCLALHGAPGSVYDMLELAPSLMEAGIRLVIPEFPGGFLDKTIK